MFALKYFIAASYYNWGGESDRQKVYFTLAHFQHLVGGGDRLAKSIAG